MGRSVTSRSTRTVTPFRDGRATPHRLRKEGMAMTIVEAARAVTGGVDTHGDVHVAAALDEVGSLLGTESFGATPEGYSALLTWLGGFGPITKVGVEGTGAYGAGLARFLARAGLAVIEVDRQNRQARRRAGAPASPTPSTPSRAPGPPCRAGPVVWPSPVTGRSRRSGSWCGQALGPPGPDQGDRPDAPAGLHRP